MTGSLPQITRDLREAPGYGPCSSEFKGAIASGPGDGNEALGSWERALQQMRFNPWGLAASRMAPGDQLSEDQLWASLARRARERWANENPY